MGIRGQVSVITLAERLPAFIMVSTVAALIVSDDSSSTTVIFNGGGYLDICGEAEHWRRQIRIAELEARIPGVEATT